MKYKVAVIAKELAELLVRLVNQNEEFSAEGFVHLDDLGLDAIGDFDIVLIGGGIGDQDIELVKQEIIKNKLKTELIEHYGGGSGLLLQELYDAVNYKI